MEPLYFLDSSHFHLHQKQFETDGTRGGWIGDNGKRRSAALRYPVTLADGKEVRTACQLPSLVDFVDLFLEAEAPHAQKRREMSRNGSPPGNSCIGKAPPTLRF